MTSPFQVNPGDLHRHASQRRMEATDFITDKPPEFGDEADDPTKSASGDLTGAVHGTNQHLHDKTHRKADEIDETADLHTAAEQERDQQVGGIGGGKLAQGVDAQGIGAIMNPFFQLAGQGLSAFGTGLSGGLQATSGLGGQALSGGANLIGQLGKAKADEHIGAELAPGASVGGGASPGGGKGKGETVPAAAHLPSGAGSSPGGLPQGYAHTEHQDRDDTTVHQAGMGGMPMGGAGLAGGGGGASGLPKATAYKKIVTPGSQPIADETPTGEIPVITEVAFAALPLPKDSHGMDT